MFSVVRICISMHVRDIHRNRYVLAQVAPVPEDFVVQNPMGGDAFAAHEGVVLRAVIPETHAAAVHAQPPVMPCRQRRRQQRIRGRIALDEPRRYHGNSTPSGDLSSDRGRGWKAHPRACFRYGKGTVRL